MGPPGFGLTGRVLFVHPLSIRIWTHGGEVFDRMSHVVRRRTQAEAERYERAITGVFRTVDDRPTGRGLIGLINGTTHEVMIVPSSTIEETGAGAVVFQAAFPDATPVRRWNGTLFLRQGRPVLGTGRGTTSRIAMLPQPVGGDAPELVLVHEMTHAFRQAAGRLRSQSLRTLGCTSADELSFPSLEEFMAVLVQNIWQSEGGVTTMRGSHTRAGRPGHLPDFPVLSGTSAAYAARWALPIAAIRAQEPGLSAVLAASNAGFNPMR